MPGDRAYERFHRAGQCVPRRRPGRLDRRDAVPLHSPERRGRSHTLYAEAYDTAEARMTSDTIDIFVAPFASTNYAAQVMADSPLLLAFQRNERQRHCL